MRMLVVSGYPAWEKVPKGLMPSFHLFGVHELVDHYEPYGDSIRGIFKKEILDGGYVDFFLWQSGKQHIASQVRKLMTKSREYDVIYDQLNRCSIFLGALKKVGLFKSNLVTVMHHPPYDIQLAVSDSDAYIFFNENYKLLAAKAEPRKIDHYFVNEWRPDMEWYQKIYEASDIKSEDTFYIDTGKSRRDRKTLMQAAENTKIRVDYAGEYNGQDGWARPYEVDLKDDIAMIKRIMKYKAEIIPVAMSRKKKIGPLGITSFMDCLGLGIPVIASDNVCFADDIVKNGLGMLYKTGDEASLSSVMKYLMENVSFYETCRRNISHYNEKYGNEYSQVFEGILKGIFKIE